MRPNALNLFILLLSSLLVFITVACGGPEKTDEELLFNDFDGIANELSLAQEIYIPGIYPEEKKDESQEGWLEGKILPNKGFEEALLALPGIQLKHALLISNALRYHVDYRFLVAGERIAVKFSADKTHIESFVYQPNIITFHRLQWNPQSELLEYSFELLPTEIKRRIVKGEIETTLNQALIDSVGVSDRTRQVVNGVLENIINFRTDARKNDTFSLLIEEQYYQGQKVPGAKVLYASYKGKRAGFHEAFSYDDGDPKSAYNAHYTPTGKALIASNLRLPVDRVHVTSPFGMRIHPVTGARQFHKGVDYGGRIGEPVFAVANGTVFKTSTDGMNGKKIILRHADGSQTYYLHLNRIGVRQGQSVGQRQVIGQIGNTGRSTGPHLHFGLKVGNKWQNPLMVKMIAAPQLDAARLAKFRTQMDDIRRKLAETEAGR